MNDWTQKIEGVENEVPPPDRKGYLLRNNTTINCNYGRANRRLMGWINLIVGSHALQSVSKSYVSFVNAIFTFVEPNPPT